MRTTVAIVGAAGLAMACAARGPDFVHGAGHRGAGLGAGAARSVVPGACVLDALIEDNFDSYAPGSLLAGQGLWKTWWSKPGTSASVTDAGSFSTPNSMWFEGSVKSDMVIEPEFKSGVITLSCMTFMPEGTGLVESVYIIALNNYIDNGGSGSASWSMQTQFNPGFLHVQNQASPSSSGNTVALITGQWVEFIAVVDLEANTLRNYYDGVQVGSTVNWYDDGVTPNVNALGPSGAKRFDAIDLYTEGFDGFLVDDLRIELTPVSCYADCDASGVLDFFDYLCFQNALTAGEPYGDCDGNGAYGVPDLLCFHVAFAGGCP